MQTEMYARKCIGSLLFVYLFFHIFLGITMALRLIGPTLGFLLASACLKLYISPTMTPIITTEDPRWMGAWWLGKGKKYDVLPESRQ